jgi:hypothetical protein
LSSPARPGRRCARPVADRRIGRRLDRVMTVSIALWRASYSPSAWRAWLAGWPGAGSRSPACCRRRPSSSPAASRPSRRSGGARDPVGGRARITWSRRTGFS